jgi:hypothetical protein
LFDHFFLGKFVDHTTPEQMQEGIVDIRIEIAGRVLTIEEYCNIISDDGDAPVVQWIE